MSSCQSAIRVHVDGLIYVKQPHGGISRVFTNLLNALDARDDVDVVLHLQARAQGIAGGLPNVPRTGLPDPLQFRPSLVFGSLNRRLEELAWKRHWAHLRSGVYHSTFYSTHSSIRIPQVLTVQDMIYEQFPDFFGSAKDQKHIEAKKATADTASAFGFPSEFSMREAAAYYDFASRPARVVPYALDQVFLEKIPDLRVRSFRETHTGGEGYILHTGSRHRHKNFGFLLCGFAMWAGKNTYRLMSIGGGQATAAESALMKGLGLEERVTFVPSVGDRELALAYRAASAFVFPSLSEGYGFPLLEAMACGVPTIALRAGSLPEVGRDVPIWVEPGDLTQLVGALGNAVVLDATSPLVRRGVEMASRRTWHDVAEEYAELYRSVLR